jgi:membrane protein DedA with SNARE-associated domain
MFFSTEMSLLAKLLNGKALQQAKLHYLTTANINRTDPFYWGGFYLVGNAAPMHFNDHTQLYWVLGLCVVGVVLLVVFLYRRRIKNQ